MSGEPQGRARDLDFFVLVKSHNHRQHADGRRELLNYHLFAEIFLKPGGSLTAATLARAGGQEAPRAFQPHGGDVLGDNAWYMEGGWYDSEAAVDTAFPNGEYQFTIELGGGVLGQGVVNLSGPGGTTEIPDPAEITLVQEGAAVNPLRLDPDQDVVVTWGGYGAGRADPNGIVDDLVFVTAADCRGRRIVKSGLCFEQKFLTYRDSSYTIPAGTFEPGRPHSMFVELPHTAHSIVAGGVPGFACFATATYLDLHTLGQAVGRPCPEAMPALDTGETDRFEAVNPA